MRLDRRSPRSERSGRLALLLAPWAIALAGCQTAGDAASATADAAESVVTATTDTVSSLVGVDPKTGPAQQRYEMSKQAGPAHFANPQLIAARGKLQTTRTEFGSRRDQLVSSPFVNARDHFRGEKTMPNSGPVLGPTVGDSAAALALLAASQSGVPLPIVQPVLARILPGFGY